MSPFLSVNFRNNVFILCRLDNEKSIFSTVSADNEGVLASGRIHPHGKEYSMKMLRNFTIRFVMLTILGIFCVMWAGVGLYSTGLCLVFLMVMTLTASWSGK